MGGKFLVTSELGVEESTLSTNDFIQTGTQQTLTDEERLQALANISNQDAGYESEVFTGKMGYVVLQPQDDTNLEKTSFAAQIANKPNTIFEIRNVYNLDTNKVTKEETLSISNYLHLGDYWYHYNENTTIQVEPSKSPSSKMTLLKAIGIDNCLLSDDKSSSILPNTTISDDVSMYLAIRESDVASYKKGSNSTESINLTSLVEIEGNAYFKHDTGISLNSGQTITASGCVILDSSNAILGTGSYEAPSSTTVYIARKAKTFDTISFKVMPYYEIPANCTLKFNGGMLKNGTINFNYAKIEALSKQCFDNVSIANNMSSTLDVKAIWFGFSTSNTTTNSSILSNLLDKCTNVSIDIEGTYPMQNAITISSTSKLKQFRSIANYMNLSESDFNSIVTLNFQANGFIILRRCIIDGIKITGNKGTWDSDNKKYVDGYVGFDIRVGCEITHCHSQNFMIGMDMSKSTIVHAHVADCLFDYNGNYGIYINEETNHISVNDIVIERCYFVNIGYNYASMTAESTKTKSGIGLYIKGGAGNTYRDNVFEYCTGVGLLIDKPESYSILNGCVLLGNYFEHNKYAQLLIDANHSSTYMSNVLCEGNMFSDSNLELPSDALLWRELVLFNRFNHGDNVVKLQHDYIHTFNDRLGFFGSEVIPYNAIEKSLADYTNNSIRIVKDNDLTCSIVIYGIKAGYYAVKVLRKNVTTAITNHRITINYKINGGSTVSFTTNEQSISDTFVEKTGARIMFKNNDYLKIAGIYTVDSDIEVLIKNIYLEKLESCTTSQLPSGTNLYTGFNIYDSTRQKQVLWNGTAWVNLDGTYMITFNIGSNIESSNDSDSAKPNKQYTTTLTAKSGFTIDTTSVVVTMGGVTQSGVYDSGTGVITIPSVTGNIVITATATQNT